MERRKANHWTKRVGLLLIVIGWVCCWLYYSHRVESFAQSRLGNTVRSWPIYTVLGSLFILWPNVAMFFLEVVELFFKQLPGLSALRKRLEKLTSDGSSRATTETEALLHTFNQFIRELPWRMIAMLNVVVVIVLLLVPSLTLQEFTTEYDRSLAYNVRVIAFFEPLDVGMLDSAERLLQYQRAFFQKSKGNFACEGTRYCLDLLEAMQHAKDEPLAKSFSERVGGVAGDYLPKQNWYCNAILQKGGPRPWSLPLTYDEALSWCALFTLAGRILIYSSNEGFYTDYVNYAQRCFEIANELETAKEVKGHPASLVGLGLTYATYLKPKAYDAYKREHAAGNYLQWSSLAGKSWLYLREARRRYEEIGKSELEESGFFDARLWNNTVDLRLLAIRHRVIEGDSTDEGGTDEQAEKAWYEMTYEPMRVILADIDTLRDLKYRRRLPEIDLTIASGYDVYYCLTSREQSGTLKPEEARNRAVKYLTQGLEGFERSGLFQKDVTVDQIVERLNVKTIANDPVTRDTVRSLILGKKGELP